MKNILYIPILLCIFLWNCDKIENPYEETSGGFDANACTDSITFPQNTNTVRNVLIEEFTGHTCGNCPSGAYDLKQYKQTYGDQMIILAIHAGGFAEVESGTGKFFTDYNTTEGTSFYEDFLIQYFPTALINRSDSAYNNLNKVVFQQDWNTAIGNFISSSPIINIQAITNYDNSSQTLCIYTETEALQNLNSNYNLVIAIAEDSIIDWQKNYALPNGSPEYAEGDIDNYIHNHLFRGNANGAYGETVMTDINITGDKVISKNTIQLSDNWNESHIHLIIYVYEETSKEVVQVIKKKI